MATNTQLKAIFIYEKQGHHLKVLGMVYENTLFLHLHDIWLIMLKNMI